jgi:protein-export membrane protein SecD
MKSLGLRSFIIVIVSLGLLTYVFPWQSTTINFPWNTGDYKLGLDLHGGVELDYKVDIEKAKAKKPDLNEDNAIDGLKSIIEKRVNTLGTAEPTIQSASYGQEKHIIVQIPTQNFSAKGMTSDQLRAKNEEYIKKAKDTIGKVIKLEFRELKKSVTDADRIERKKIAEEALAEVKLKQFPFDVIGNKYQDGYENIAYLAGSGTYTTLSGVTNSLPKEVIFAGIEKIDKPTTTEIVTTQKEDTFRLSADNKIEVVPGENGYAIIKINSVTSAQKEHEKPATVGSGTIKVPYTEKTYDYEAIFINQKPSEWTPATGNDGKTVLNEQYLIRATVGHDSLLRPQIDLLFNTDGAKLFAEITQRLIKQQLAIFVGGRLITSPTVQSVIPNGQAVITGNYSNEEAIQLANNINTGIVPADIYLTSERTIDAKIGVDSLRVISLAGIIGLVLILVFLISIYRFSGLLAGIALIVYGILLLAIVKYFGIVLTLASIAGIILSLGLAIDANVLIFERTKEELQKKNPLTKSILIGFGKSWSAIWDSHVTSFSSAVVLYFFGINLIKGFGLMLIIGILLSLFTAMWISRVLILTAARSFEKKTKCFIGQE